MSPTSFIRWLLTLVLLIICWQHVHWSVALTLTLLTVQGEIHTCLLAVATRLGVEGMEIATSLKRGFYGNKTEGN